MSENEELHGELLEFNANPPEAAASINVRFASKLGYDYLLTVRSFKETGAGLELLDLIPTIEQKLYDYEFHPIFGKNSGNATTAPKPVVTAQKAKTIMCPKHNAKAGLKTNKETNAQWYSHKLGDGTWCNVDEPK